MSAVLLSGLVTLETRPLSLSGPVAPLLRNYKTGINALNVEILRK